MDKQEIISKLGLQGVTAQSGDADIIAAISKQLEAYKTRISELESAEKTAKKKAIDETVNAAIKSGVISEAQKEHFVTVGETSGMDVLKAILPASKPKTIAEQIKNKREDAAPINSVDWDWDIWQEKNPRGLEKLEAEDPAQFAKLYAEKYGN